LPARFSIESASNLDRQEPTMSDESFPLPDDLPEPEDDGAADHLPGATVPSISLPATDGEAIDLAALPGRVGVYAYP